MIEVSWFLFLLASLVLIATPNHRCQCPNYISV